MKIKRVLDSINHRSLRRLLRGLYHRKGPGRKPYNPLSMLKAQLLNHLLRIPSDRRLALRLKHDWRAARACRFRKRTPSHGLFTQFRHRLGEETYREIFNRILRRLFESDAIIGKVIAVRAREHPPGGLQPERQARARIRMPVSAVASGVSSSDTG